MKVKFRITSSKINNNSVESIIKNNNAGSYLFFHGKVRNNNNKKNVKYLFYEANLILSKIEFLKIINEINNNFLIISIYCIHRCGIVLVGETALYIAVLSKHRKSSFLALQYLINNLKKRLPIFKKEYYTNSTSIWINNTCSCDFENNQENKRYDKQKLIPFIKENGQLLLKNSKILIIGIGGLGSPALMYLSSAGIGNIGILEYDLLEAENLNRQFIYNPIEIGKRKSLLAKQKILNFNKKINLKILNYKINKKNIIKSIKDYSIIIDCTDNFKTKLLINDACYYAKKTLIRSSIHQMDGQIEVYNPLNDGPCVRCLWSNNTKNVLSCNESGVLGTTSGIFGILQAQEAIKFLLKQKTLKNGEILFANLLENNFYKITYKKYRNCILCSSFNKSKSLKDFYENFKQQDAQFITMNN